MISVADIAHTWNDFTSYSNTTKYLRSLAKKSVIIKYLKAIDRLPYLTWETCITNVKWMRFRDINALSKGLQEFKGEVIISPNALFCQCHTVAELDKKLNPNWKRCIGFSLNDDDSSTEWHYHSFCIDEQGNIIEPTPIKRSRYYGVIITDKESKYG